MQQSPDEQHPGNRASALDPRVNQRHDLLETRPDPRVKDDAGAVAGDQLPAPVRAPQKGRAVVEVDGNRVRRGRDQRGSKLSDD